jgi:hypothetical protein
MQQRQYPGDLLLAARKDQGGREKTVFTELGAGGKHLPQRTENGRALLGLPEAGGAALSDQSGSAGTRLPNVFSDTIQK